MIRGFTAALAAATLLAASPALAQTNHRSVVASRAPSAASARTWLISVHDWETPYLVLATDYQTFLQELMQSGSEAARYFGQGDKAGGDAWAGTWAADRTSRYQALTARAQALGTAGPPKPPPEVLAEITRHPDELVVLRGLDTATRTIVANIQGDGVVVNAAVEDATRTAGGDHSAYIVLRSQLLQLEIAGLRNAEATSSVTLSPPDDPETDSDHGVVHFDEVMVTILKAASVAYAGGTPDRAATAATLRQQAISIDADAAAMESHAATRLRQLTAMPGAPASLAAQLRTFPQSAAAERQVTAGIRTVASLIEQPASTPDDWVKAIHDDLSPGADALGALGDKRTALGEANAPR